MIYPPSSVAIVHSKRYIALILSIQSCRFQFMTSYRRRTLLSFYPALLLLSLLIIMRIIKFRRNIDEPSGYFVCACAVTYAMTDIPILTTVFIDMANDEIDPPPPSSSLLLPTNETCTAQFLRNANKINNDQNKTTQIGLALLQMEITPFHGSHCTFHMRKMFAFFSP